MRGGLFRNHFGRKSQIIYPSLSLIFIMILVIQPVTGQLAYFSDELKKSRIYSWNCVDQRLDKKNDFNTSFCGIFESNQFYRDTGNNTVTIKILKDLSGIDHVEAQDNQELYFQAMMNGNEAGGFVEIFYIWTIFVDTTNS